MNILDFFDMHCPNCAVTIRLYAKKHVLRRNWNCEMCNSSFEIYLPNWIIESGFFLEKCSDEKKPYYFATTDDPAKLIQMQVRMAQLAIKRDSKKEC